MQDSFPIKRLVAKDGMAVTAEVWNEAHDYHRQLLAAKDSCLYGGGILSGLNIHAASPAHPQVIHGEKGSALDDLGHIITIPNSFEVNLSDQTGLIYLILRFTGESQIEHRNAKDNEDAPSYYRTDFSVDPVTTLPSQPYIELARIRRTNPNIPISDAANLELVKAQEIDLRFRREFRQRLTNPVAIALVSPDRNLPAQHWQGWQNLARELRNGGTYSVWTIANAPFDKELANYPLICLSAQQSFTLGETERHFLREYVRNGGLLFCENCQRSNSNPGTDRSFEDLIQWIGGSLQDAPPIHPLFTSPHYFAVIPDGYEAQNNMSLRISTPIEKGMAIVSRQDYGCLWNGDRRGGRANRSALRDGFDWGENLLYFALNRRQS